jgi:hypothetical protein
MAHLYHHHCDMTSPFLMFDLKVVEFKTTQRFEETYTQRFGLKTIFENILKFEITPQNN